MLQGNLEARPYRARGGNLPMSRSRLIDTDFGSIDVFETGRQDGPAIVLITHGLGSLESFEEIAEQLAIRLPDRRIVTYSRPGRGRTAALDEANASDSAEALMVLPALLRALGIRRADIVGHSDGATVAMIFASVNPEMVNHIVALSPQVYADRQFVETTRNLPSDERALGISARLGAFHLNEGLTYRHWREAREALCAAPDGMLNLIDKLKAPTLLVQGLRDEYGSSEQISSVAARISGPVKWVLLRQDGHYPHCDNPYVVLDLIESHLGPSTAKDLAHLPAASSVSFV